MTEFTVSARNYRQALIQLIAGAARKSDAAHWPEAVADALLADGYAKPKTMHTAMELDILGVGSVIWVYDRRSADWNSWQLFDDVTELRDEDGELLKKAWVSPAYGREMSSMGLQNFSDGKPITVLREVGTK